MRDQGELHWYFDRRSRWIAESGIPYTADHPQEYPPLAVLYYSWPRTLTDDFTVYSLIFALQEIVLFGLLAGVTALLLDEYRRGTRRLALFLLPAFMFFSLWRFDLLPSLLASAALLALVRRHPGWALGLLTIGTLVKFYPAIFFVPFLIWMAGAGRDGASRRSTIARSLAPTVILAVVGVVGVSLAAGIGALPGVIGAQMLRKFDIGTLGTALIFIPFLRSRPQFLVGLLHGLKSVFICLQFAPAIFLLFCGRFRDREGLARSCAFVLIPLIFFSSFFSQGFLLWLTPLILLTADRKELWLLALLDAAIFIEFPVLFGIDPLSPIYAAFGLCKYAILAALWLINLGYLRRAEVFFRSDDGLPAAETVAK